MKLTKAYSVVIQIVGWLLFFCVPLLAIPNFEISDTQKLRYLMPSFLVNNLFLVFVFYFNFNFLVPKFIFKHRLYAYFFYISLLILFCLLVNHFVKEYFSLEQEIRNAPPRGFNRNPGHPPPPNSFFGRLFGPILSYFLIVLFSSLIALLSEKIKSDEEKKQIQLEKSAAELSALKLQISPHFLFNTLNNIRWLARKKSNATEDAVVKLATLLRYIIYQTNDEKVALSKEIGHLKDFIGLQKMRISENTQVNFEVIGDIANKTIEPLLFIPFVENAFKFGTNETLESQINIRIEISGNSLSFLTENNVFENDGIKESESSGLGITNVKQRLNLLYPNAHTLTVTETAGIYKTTLNIKLSDG